MSDQSSQWVLYLLLVCFIVVLIGFYIVLHLFRVAVIQQLLVLLLSGFIQLYAGLYLFKSNSLECFISIKGVLSLVPTLMDLKGNIEITMASRMATVANTTDSMKSIAGTTKLIKQNIILIQCQVTIISLFAVAITIIFLWINGNVLTFSRVIILCAIGLGTGALACTLLGSVVTIVISFLSKSGFDPDDVATSIAASFGDLITVLCIVNLTCFFFNQYKSGLTYVPSIVTSVLVFIFPFVMYCTLKNPATRPTIIHCWPPIIASTLISLVAGFILESSNEKFKQITLLTPVFGGVVGDCTSMIASKIATNFKRIESLNGERPVVKMFLTPKDIYVRYEHNEKISMMCRSHLTHVIIPCQFAYLLTLRVLKGEDFIQLTVSFILIYLLMAAIMLVIMTFITFNLIHIAMRHDLEPDEAVIPIATSLTDLLASIFLLIFYKILILLSDPNVDIKPQ